MIPPPGLEGFNGNRRALCQPISEVQVLIHGFVCGQGIHRGLDDNSMPPRQSFDITVISPTNDSGHWNALRETRINHKPIARIYSLISDR